MFSNKNLEVKAFFTYLSLYFEMNFSKKIKPFFLILSLFISGMLSAQSDTLIDANTKGKSTPEIKSANPVFSSKVSTSDTLDDGVILENLPQPKQAKNAFFGEIFTNGGLYSLNYDRILFRKERWAMTVRSGLFFWPKGQSTMGGSLVIEPNVLIGTEKYFFEGGLGYTRFNIYEKTRDKEGQAYKQTDSENYISARIGFRMQNRVGDGLFFRAGLTPIVYYIDSEGSDWFFQLLGGLGFGISF